MELSQLNILYQSVFPKFKSWIINNLGTQEDAHDTFQEILESLLIKEKLGTLKINSSLDAYVFQACKFKWIDQLRKNKRQGEVLSLDEKLHLSKDESIQMNELAEEKKKYDMLDQSFTLLSELCQKLLSMVKQGIKPADIAIALGASNANTINRRKFACMQTWKKHLQNLKSQNS